MVDVDQPTRHRHEVRDGGGGSQGPGRPTGSHIDWHPKRDGGREVRRLGVHVRTGADRLAEPSHKGAQVQGFGKGPIVARAGRSRHELQWLEIPHSVVYKRRLGMVTAQRRGSSRSGELGGPQAGDKDAFELRQRHDVGPRAAGREVVQRRPRKVGVICDLRTVAFPKGGKQPNCDLLGVSGCNGGIRNKLSVRPVVVRAVRARWRQGLAPSGHVVTFTHIGAGDVEAARRHAVGPLVLGGVSGV